MMGVVRHAQGLQNRMLVIFLQYLIATAFVFFCDAKHIFYVGPVTFIFICFQPKRIDFNGGKVWEELETEQKSYCKRDFKNSN